jgi:hypothetical protein
VLVFGVSDIIAAVPSPYELHPLPTALIGRLIGVWLLWVVAVEVPVLGRQLGLSWRRLSGNRFAVAALVAAATGALVWTWTQAATVLIRPVFTWSTLVSGVTLAAVRAVQTAGLVFAIAGALVAGIGVIVRGPDRLLVARPPRRRAARTGLLAVLASVVRQVVVATFLTLMLAGLISWPVEAAVLFVVLLVSGPLARFVADRTRLGTVLLTLPPIARIAIAAVLSFVLAQLTIGPLYHFAAVDTSGRYPQFFSVIVAVCVGIIAVRLATTPGRRPVGVTSVASTAVVGLLLGGLLLLLVVVAPAGVAADNCASLSDCWGTPFLAALAGGSLPFAFYTALYWGPGPQPPKPIPPTRHATPPQMPPGYDPPRINWGPPPPLPPETPDEKERREQDNQKRRDYWDREQRRQERDPKFKDPDLQQRERDHIQKQRDYWNSNPSMPQNDAEAPSDHAVASSGAGTRG